MCNLAVKYHLTQQVGVPTRDKQVLDLIWSSHPDLFSNIMLDSFKEFTDHSVVTAITSFNLTRDVEKEEIFLLESGRRFKQLDFTKAPWPDVQTRLAELDWGPLESLAKQDVTAAHNLFINTILPVMVDLVPRKVSGKKFGHRRKHKQRRCLWRKLGRTKKKLHSSSSVRKTAALLQTQRDLERELKSSYESQSWEEETKVVTAMKSNVKGLCIWSRQAENKSKGGAILGSCHRCP